MYGLDVHVHVHVYVHVHVHVLPNKVQTGDKTHTYVFNIFNTYTIS